MSRLDPSTVFVTIASGGSGDFTDKDNYPKGIDGIYANEEGTVTITDQSGTSHDFEVVAGAQPPVCGWVNITATTAEIVVGIG